MKVASACVYCRYLWGTLMFGHHGQWTHMVCATKMPNNSTVKVSRIGSEQMWEVCTDGIDKFYTMIIIIVLYSSENIYIALLLWQ